MAIRANGTVDCDMLDAYLKAHPHLRKGGTNGERTKSQEDALTAQVNRQIQEAKLLKIRKETISRAEMGARLRTLAGKQREIAETYLTMEQLEDFCAAMRELVNEWVNPTA